MGVSRSVPGTLSAKVTHSIPFTTIVKIERVCKANAKNLRPSDQILESRTDHFRNSAERKSVS